VRVIQYITLLLLCCSPFGYHAQSEQEMRKQAEQMFNSGKYVDATPLYTRLLALQPRDYGYNFRYGACLLFNSAKKQDALKYLNYAVQDPSTQPDIFYFIGRALHLNYQFNEAIDNYTAYRKSGKNNVFLKETERFIEMCQNGKQLLSNITDIIVLDKKEIASDKFFRLYDLKDIGGNILVTLEFQTKLDKKNNHQPIIHFPNQPKAIFYASYGETGSSGKDIYVRIKQQDGTWGEPQVLKGGVNTAFDEDYPYMHPDGQSLYFASKGHNSMGGFDIFRSKYDEFKQEFGPAENMDFAVSSPDDDLFFVLDSLNRDAYFASARQSEAGKLTVYKVKVDRVPLQLAVLKGDFVSKIDNNLISARIDVVNSSTGKKVGTYQTNKDSDYMITLPKAGEYEFVVRVGDNPQEYRSKVVVPQLSAFRPLKQQLVHTEENGREIVRVVNLFDEQIDNPEDVLAEVIRVRSALDVNVQDFDLASFESTQQYRKVLAEIGLANLNNSEVVEVLAEQIVQAEKQLTFNSELQTKVTAIVSQTTSEISELEELIKSKVQAATAASSDQEKYTQLLEAQYAIQKQEELKLEAQELIKMADSVDQVIKQGEIARGKDQLTEIKSAFESAISSGQQGDAWKVLAEKSETIRATMDNKSANIIERNVSRQVEIEQQLATERNKRTALEADKEKAENEVYQLNLTLNAAKKKDQPTIQSAIEKKKAEIQLLVEEIAAAEPKETVLTNQLNKLKAELTVIQKATDSQSTSITTTRQEVLKELFATNSANSSSLHVFVDQQIGELIKNNPELTNVKNTSTEERNESTDPNDQLVNEMQEKAEPSDPQAVQLTVDPSYETDVNEIELTSTLPEKDKQLALVQRDEEFIAQIDQALNQVENELKRQPENDQLRAKKVTLSNLKTAASDRIQTRTESIKANEKKVEAETDVKPIISSTQLLIDSHASDVEQVKSTTSYTEEQRLSALDQTDEVLRSALSERLKVIQQELVDSPSSVALLDEQVQIEEQLNVLDATMSERQQLRDVKKNKADELARNAQKESNETDVNPEKVDVEKEQRVMEEKKIDPTQAKKEYSAPELLEEIFPNYSARKEQLLNSKLEERKKQEQLMEFENEALTQLEKQLIDEQKKSDESNQKKEELLVELIENQKNTISQLKRSIAELDQLQQKAYVAELRSSGDTQLESLLSGVTGSEKAVLESQLAQLEDYRAVLQVKEDELVRTNQTKEVSWINEEISQVDKTVKKIRITIGELERLSSDQDQLVAKEEKEAERVENREQQLERQLSSPELTKKEKKDFSRELNDIQEGKAVVEVKKLTEKQVETTAAIDQLTTGLKAVSSVNEATKINQAIANLATERIESEIRVLQEKADNTKDAREKKEVLQSIAEKQEKVKEELTSAYIQNKLLEIERNAQGGSLENITELTARKRKYTIQVGELTKLMSYIDEEITGARGKEKTELQASKVQLANQKKVISDAINTIDERMARLSLPQEPVMNAKSLDQAVTVEEELLIAQTNEYKQVAENGTKLLELEKELSRLSSLIGQQKAALKVIVSNAPADEKQIEATVNQLKATNEQLSRVEAEIETSKGEFNRSLPADQQKALVIQNMIQRGIQPIDRAQMAMAIVPLPEMGLEITEKQVNRSIPLGVKNPTGLVYRVQVGAFAKPIPGELFKEFNPVFGEAIPNSNIMRYMAGFFNNSQRAISARDEIRKLGYADAFAVAYCDGKRISLAEARRLEQAGLCLAKGTNQLMLEVAMNTMEKIQLDDTTKRVRVNPLDYNKADGAAPATAIEASKGLFYTVQLGVFNRPIAANTVYQLEPLMTLRLPNGQIRYSVGLFNSIEEAQSMQAKSRAKGIPDAFITAYFKGQRITLEEAKQLIATRGTKVLESNIIKTSGPQLDGTTSSKVATGEVTLNRTVEEDSIIFILQQDVQLVSKMTYAEYPREELNRYNSKGFFYYDETDQRIKSNVANSAEQLPPVYYFRNDLDTIQLAKKKDSIHYFKLDIDKMELGGDFSEWFVRYPGRKELREVETGIEIRIFDKTEKQREHILSTLRLLELIYTEEWLTPAAEN
jgi:hypothetical protein